MPDARHIVVTGATGNVGLSVVRALERDPAVASIAGLARRTPNLRLPKTSWQAADVTRDDLVPHFLGADVVIHLAWRIQPSRDEALTRSVNVEGSGRVFAAAAKAEVPALVYASSVGAYSPGPKTPVDEGWPTGGITSSFYSRHKALVERELDRFEASHPQVRVVRLRPGLIFQREAGSEIRRLFAGPLLPSPLVRPGLIPLFPQIDGLVFQAVHSDDVAEAYRLAATRDVRGAFNLAAEPILDSARLAELFNARSVSVPTRLIRGLMQASWRARLQPSPAGWLDMALQTPLMDSSRARSELGWAPAHSSEAALLELLEGMRRSAGAPTPPLDPKAGGPLRIGEFLSGVGAR